MFARSIFDLLNTFGKEEGHGLTPKGIFSEM